MVTFVVGMILTGRGIGSFSAAGNVLFLHLGIPSMEDLWDFTVLICISFCMFMNLQHKVCLKQFLEDSFRKHSEIFIT